MKNRTAIFALGILVSSQINATNLRTIYLDETKNVHVITIDGRDLQLTRDGRGTNAKLSPHGETAAWVMIANTGDQAGGDDGGSELAIYRNGSVRFINCEPFIRGYWFWMKGNRIAIDCGGRHFAGREVLYDVDTLKPLESFEQASVPTDKRPSWSESSDQFSPDE